MVNTVAAADANPSPSIVEFDMGPLTAKPHLVDDDTKRTTPLCEEEDYTSVSASVSPPAEEEEQEAAAAGKGEEDKDQKQQQEEGGDKENDDEASEISSLCGIEHGFVDDVEASIRSLEQSVLPTNGSSGPQQQQQYNKPEATPLQNGGGAGAAAVAATDDLLIEQSVSSRYRDYKLRPPTPELPTSLLGPDQQQQHEEDIMGSQMSASGGGRRGAQRNGSSSSSPATKPSFNAFLQQHKQQRKKSVFEKNLDYIEGEAIKRASTLERNIQYISKESQGILLREFSLHGGGGSGAIPPSASSSSLHGSVAAATAAAGTTAIKDEDSVSMSSMSTRSVVTDVKDTAASAATTFSRNLDYIRAGGLLTEYDSEEEELLDDQDHLSSEVSSFIHARARVFTRNIGTLLNVSSLVKPTPTRK